MTLINLIYAVVISFSFLSWIFFEIRKRIPLKVGDRFTVSALIKEESDIGGLPPLRRRPAYDERVIDTITHKNTPNVFTVTEKTTNISGETVYTFVDSAEPERTQFWNLVKPKQNWISFFFNPVKFDLKDYVHNSASGMIIQIGIEIKILSVLERLGCYGM
jgi:hypothetical protein